jgi:hypothetical protein
VPGKLIVLSSPAEGREDEYNQWYDEVHLGEVLALGPFTEATRYKVSEHQAFPAEHDYAAVYSFEGPADAALAALVDGASTMQMSDSMAAAHMVLLEDR